ncbi:hypothetical protein [Kordiimonas aestuarii]|uniref:hypothetical protein n=1 Tax=Kordiimonas aestuarii TaxID=1005925 RepID=UPI0021D0A537|nr:hypothetical protein [Kordiimonas aestuarii]
MFRFKSVIASVALLLSAGMSATARDAEQENAPDARTQQEQKLEGLRFMLRRAEFVRLLAAEHLQYLNANRDKAAFHMLEEASQVMSYNLICDDEAMDGRTLNNIAAQTTLQISTLIDESPAGETMAEAMKTLGVGDRLVLLADVSTAVFMFKIGRRRGLFDALLTDFGPKRFCSGMGSDMRRRYNGLVAGLPGDE